LTHFEIQEKPSQYLGLIERTAANAFSFVRDRHELQYDHLYYLYFREKPDRSLIYNGAQGHGEEETKKVSVRV
jgi:hypothetical protein